VSGLPDDAERLTGVAHEEIILDDGRVYTSE